MIRSITIRYAARNLWRHPARTVITIVGMALGGTIAIFAVAMTKGEDGMIADAVANSGMGHFLIAPLEWQRLRDSNIELPSQWQTLRQAIAGIRTVKD
ncbi:MAG: hypothetical protein D6820_08080, partial [Lentisphaerae bacterium]